MKRWFCASLALLFYASLLPWAGAADFWRYNASDINFEGYGLMDNTYKLSAPYVDVRAHGTAFTHVPIQTALSAIDNSIGADVFIPRGQYEIGTGLLLQNKSNVVVRGAGKDATILRMDLGAATKPAVYNANSWGILSIESNAALDTNVNNIRIEDMTFWLDNTGTPGTQAADEANGKYYIKNVYFRGVTNITFKNVKIRGSRWEALYTDGNSSSPPTKIRVIDSDFLDTQHNAFNTNTGNAAEVIVDRCFFDNTAFGVQVVGNRGIISNNIFKDVNNGIIVAEASYPVASADTRGWTISGNIITGLGQNATTTANVYGINVNGGDSQFTDNTVDNGLIVSNNSVINSVKRSTNAGPITAYRLAGGNLKASNNHVSGVTKEAGATGDVVAYFIGKGVASGAARQQVYFSGNTLDNVLSGNQWDGGVQIAGGDNSYIYMSNNIITGVEDTDYALYIPTAAGSPFVSLSGDILNGSIYYPGKWGGGVLNTSYEYNDQRIHGSSVKGLRTDSSDDIVFATFTDNAATPSVAAGKHFKTANTGATTITNFTGGGKGEVKSITFTDNVTVVQNNASIMLSGAANFTATPNDTLTILHDGTKWRELHRSVN